jgi:hypothetical protein
VSLNCSKYQYKLNTYLDLIEPVEFEFDKWGVGRNPILLMLGARPFAQLAVSSTNKKSTSFKGLGGNQHSDTEHNKKTV